MAISTLDILQTPVIGVFATCTEDFAFVPQGLDVKSQNAIEELLQVNICEVVVNQSSLIGSMLKGNSYGIVVPQGELSGLEDTGLKITIITDKLNALGNIILANDTSALVHPELSDHTLELISNSLNVEAYRGTIAGIKTVGMAATATNKGILVHPLATVDEIEFLEQIFDLPVKAGTANYGVPLVGSGLLANTKGFVAGSKTTGHELGRIEKALGFISD